MSRMFKTDDGKRVETINPHTGCNYNCVYCWARSLSAKKLKKHYPNGFIPEFHPERLRTIERYNKKTVFVGSMCDMWGDWIPDEQIAEVLDACTMAPRSNTFMFCTKNPGRYLDFFGKKMEPMPNFILGATVETNRDENYRAYSQAPLPTTRLFDLRQLRKQHPMARIFISIEPIMAFDAEIFYKALHHIHPEIIYVGIDNYYGALPNPSAEDAWTLVQTLRDYLYNVDVRLKTMPARRLPYEHKDTGIEGAAGQVPEESREIPR